MGWKTLRFEQRQTPTGQQIVECWLDEDNRPRQLLEIVNVSDQLEAPRVIQGFYMRYSHLTGNC